MLRLILLTFALVLIWLTIAIGPQLQRNWAAYKQLQGITKGVR